MHLSSPLAMVIFSLTTLSHAAAATILHPPTTACTTLSTCEPDYKSCGADEYHSPHLLASCCAANTTCPSHTVCNPQSHGSQAPASLPANRTASISGYDFCGTSSAHTSLTAQANRSRTITSASKPGNLSLPLAPSTVSNNRTAVPPSSVISGISAGPVANFTSEGTVPPTTGTAASPTSAGGEGRACRLTPGVGVGSLVVGMGVALAVMGCLL